MSRNISKSNALVPGGQRKLATRRQEAPATSVDSPESHVEPDAPTDVDRRRARLARARAHRCIEVIDEARRAAIQSVFRSELGTTVRSASPFLIALLAKEGLTLDAVVLTLEPQPGWPYRPRLGHSGAADHKAGRHLVRHYLAGLFPKGRTVPPYRDSGRGYVIDRADDDWIRIEVAGHSLEVAARIGPVRFETHFGELRVELDGELPETLAIGCVGRLIEDVVDHEALRGRAWPITAVEDAAMPFVGPVLVVTTGCEAFRMPWVR